MLVIKIFYCFYEYVWVKKLVVSENHFNAFKIPYTQIYADMLSLKYLRADMNF